MEPLEPPWIRPCYVMCTYEAKVFPMMCENTFNKHVVYVLAIVQQYL